MANYSSKTEKFLIESTLLNQNDGTSKDISENILNVFIQNDYIENSFPLFVVNIRGTQELIEEIQFNDVKIYLKISSYIQESTEAEEDEDNIIINNIVLETTIRCYDKPVKKENKTEDVDTAEENENIGTSAAFFEYQISGIPEDLIEKNKNIINDVFEDATLNEILVNIFSSLDNNELYLEESPNTTREQSLLIPPLNLIQTVKYLQTFYGIFDDGLVLFFDTNKTFLYSLTNEKKEYENTFSIQLKEAKSTADSSIYNRPLFDSNDNIMMYIRSLTSFVSQKQIISDNIGSQTIFYSYDENFNLNIRKKSNNEIFEKTRYYWNQNKEKISEDQFYNANKKTDAISFIFNNINYKYFKPTTKFLLNTNDSNIDGEYSLVENSIAFSTSDFKHYTSYNSLKLIKIK
jgi:hypothetical protein